MRRRDFLSAALVAPAAFRLVAAGAAATWRTFEITNRLELIDARGPSRAWVPLPLTRETPYQRNGGHTIGGNATRASVFRDPRSGAAMVVAEWPAGVAPVLEVTMRASTSNHQIPLDRRSPSLSRPADLADDLRPTALIPLDGVVRETAMAITRGHATDLARARAIYDWIVENTVRDPEVKGCGLGDIRWMLDTKNLSGKCADLNALFVGLARAAGLPARDLYGIRVAPSTQFPSLGRAGGNVTTAQHCRAEVYLEGFGWVPVDPADVRKLILEERRQASPGRRGSRCRS